MYSTTIDTISSGNITVLQIYLVFMTHLHSTHPGEVYCQYGVRSPLRMTGNISTNQTCERCRVIPAFCGTAAPCDPLIGGAKAVTLSSVRNGAHTGVKCFVNESVNVRNVPQVDFRQIAEVASRSTTADFPRARIVLNYRLLVLISHTITVTSAKY